MLLAAAKYLGCFNNTNFGALSTVLNPVDLPYVSLEECQALAAAATPVQPLFGVVQGQCFGSTDLSQATSVGRAQESDCTSDKTFEVRGEGGP